MSVTSTRRRITRVHLSPVGGEPRGEPRGPIERDDLGDELTVEAPLNLIVGEQVIATLMRTPGHDLELAAGWLAVESGVHQDSDLTGLRQCRTGDELPARAEDPSTGRGIDQVHVRLAPGVTPPQPRAWITGAACGVCSADVLDLTPMRWAPARSTGWTVPAQVLHALPEAVRARQRTFHRTGSLHAAALATATGELLVVREDVGRHNAVDKVNGWAVLSGRMPGTDLLLCVSGRVSFEIVQKAIAGSVAAIVAVSAPSDLAVDLAREHGLVLVGMVRGNRMNIYAGADYVGGLG